MSEIRKLTPIDLEPFRKIRLLGLIEAPDAFATNAQSWSEASDDVVENLIRNNAGISVFGAFENQTLVGIAGIKREQRDSVQHKASLWGLFVDPTFRKQGIARLLVQAVISDAASRSGVEMIRLVVPATAISAMKLFKSEGFEAYGLEPRARVCEGRYVDQHYLYQFLSNEL